MKKLTTNQMLEQVLKNQITIIDLLKWTIYNQHPERKFQFSIKPEDLKELGRKYNYD